MTLIIGVKCEDGVVVAADSIRTFGSYIEQEVSNKIQIEESNVLVATSGVVGLSQLVKAELRHHWTTVKEQQEVADSRNLISSAMLPPIRRTKQRADSLNQKFQGCSSLVAFPLNDIPVLLQYNHFADSLEVTTESPFVSIGSGSFQADPFLAFIKRTFWLDQAPKTLSEGIFGALWTLQHVTTVNAGLGVGGRSRIAVLKKAGQSWIADFVSEEHVFSHQEAIADAERELSRFRNRFNLDFEGAQTG